MEFNQNRLRFVHCEHLFDNIEQIKEYVSKKQHSRPSLYAEPQIFKYGDEAEPKLVLAIGSVGEGKFVYDAESGTILNKTYYIDFSKTEEDIKTLFNETSEIKEDLVNVHDVISNIINASGFDEEGNYVKEASDLILANAENLANADKLLSEYIQYVEKKLTLSSEETNSLKLDVNVSDEGTLIKGDVKRGSMIYENHVIKNIIIEQEDGIFTSVDLDFVDNNDETKLVFTINGSEKKDIELPSELHIVRGEYKVEDESLHLALNREMIVDGVATSDIKIDLHKLIDEWTVLGIASETPIVLTKEHVISDNAEHFGLHTWQDVLSADVRITDKSDNILTRSDNGKALYVKGTADNIAYTNVDGKGVTVQEALESSFSKISDADGNIISLKDKGLFAKIDLEYNEGTNELIFIYSDKEGRVNRKNPIKLNTVQFFEEVYYDAVENKVIVQYKDTANQVNKIEIPIKDILVSFDVNNDNRTVELSRTTNEKGMHTLSADVRIAQTAENNILEVVGHELYVNGSANNIKVSNAAKVLGLGENVDTFLVQLNQKLENYKAEESAARESADNEIITNLNYAKLESEAAHLAFEDMLADEANRAKTAEESLADSIESESERAQSAEEVLASNLEKEVNRSVAKDEALKSALDIEIENRKDADIEIKGLLNDEFNRAKDAEEALKDAFNEHKILNNNAFETINNNLEAERNRAVAAEQILEGKINDEITRATDKDESLQNELEQAKLDLSFIVRNSNTVRLTRTQETSGFSIKADVIVSENAGNVIKYNETDGIYASVDLNYDAQTNRIILSTSGKEKSIQLNSSAINSIHYDNDNKTIVIGYISDNGDYHESIVPVQDLFNQWTVDNSQNGGVILSKVNNHGGDNNDIDVLSARVNLSMLPDNMLVNNSGALHVSNKADGIIMPDNRSIVTHIDELKAKDNELFLSINTVEDMVYAEATRASEVENNIQTELDNLEASVGTDINGLYVTPTNTNYIGKLAEGTNTIASDLKALDNQAKANADEIIVEKNRSIGEESRIESKLDNEINRSTSTDEAIQSEIDTTQASIGLDANGVYITPTDTNYIGKLAEGTNTIVSDLKALDNQSKVNADAILTEKDRAIGEESRIESKLDNEINRSTSTDEAIQSELDATQTSIGLNSDGTFNHSLIHSANYIAESDTVVDSLLALDNALSESEGKLNKAVESVGLNTDGSHKQANGNYTSDATTITEEIAALDSQVKQNADAILAEVTNRGASISSVNTEIDNIEASVGLSNNGELVRESGHYTTATTILGRIENVDAKLYETVTKLDAEIGRSTSKDADLLNAIDTEKDRAIAADAEINVEIDNIEKAVGLILSTGELSDNRGNYVSTATTVMGKMVDLDAQVKINTDNISTLSSTLDNEIARAVAQEDKIEKYVGLNSDGSYVYKPNSHYINNTESVMEAVQALDTELFNTKNEINSSSNDVQAELDVTQASVGLNANGTYAKSVDATYVASATSVTHSVEILDRKAKENADNIATEVARSTAKESELASSISTVNADLLETKTALANEIQDRKDAIKELDDTIVREIADREAWTTTLNDRIENEATLREQVDTDIRTNLDNLRVDLTSESSRATAAEIRLDDKISGVTDTINSLNSDFNTKLSAEVTRATEADTVLNKSITDEVTRAKGVESLLRADVNTLSSATNTMREQIDGISALTNSNVVMVQDTNTVDLTKTVVESGGYQLSADVKLSNKNGNIITEENDGILAKVLLSYDTALNKLTFTAGAETSEIQLNSVSTIKRIYYNPIDKKICMVYDLSGVEQETCFLASDLFKAVLAKNDSTLNNIIMTVATNEITGGYDISGNLPFSENVDNTNATVTLSATDNNKLTANVNISSREKNLLKVDEQHLLYVEVNGNNMTVVLPNANDPTETSEVTLQNAISYLFTEIFRLKSFIDDASGMINQMLQDINNLKQKTAISAFDTPTLDVSYSASENQATLKGAVVLSKDVHNLLEVYNDGLVHYGDGNGNWVTTSLTTSSITNSEGEIETINVTSITGIDSSTNGIVFDGSIDYRTYLSDKTYPDKDALHTNGWTRYLQLKRNDATNIFATSKQAINFLNDQTFLSDKRDGEPILARYTNENDRLMFVEGKVYDVNGVKGIQTINQRGTVIDKFEYHNCAATTSYTDVSGHTTNVNIPAEHIYFQYTDSADDIHHLLIPMASLIDEYKYPTERSSFSGAATNAVSDNKSIKTYHNVKFEVKRSENADCTSNIYADIDYYDCGEY